MVFALTAVPQVYREMEPHPALLMKLLPYQKEFLAWAIDQVRLVALLAVCSQVHVHCSACDALPEGVPGLGHRQEMPVGQLAVPSPVGGLTFPSRFVSA